MVPILILYNEKENIKNTKNNIKIIISACIIWEASEAEKDETNILQRVLEWYFLKNQQKDESETDTF